MSLSKSLAIGQDMGKVIHIRAVTIGQKITAILIYDSPVQRACGIISPNIRTAVTEIIITSSGLTTLSRKSGSASIAKALHSSNVTSIQWF